MSTSLSDGRSVSERLADFGDIDLVSNRSNSNIYPFLVTNATVVTESVKEDEADGDVVFL